MKNSKLKKSEKEIQNDLLNSIELMRDTKDINDYVFIYDFDGTSIYYPISEKKYWKKIYMNLQTKQVKELSKN